ncbi:acetyl esterase/lipase [Neolewinella xylanilytica]|uniref:Acetyl esterase/lipase n=1 Tax=Neolewinella xylanilytica TaxID=1514080 RepID=A0A2S6I080_9BACT|nr:alpha/beta hydrolase [Neolewinella xylanilytica]PPK84273.1 acetyl esterase/lipase [Neolewinella xylanilytica]
MRLFLALGLLLTLPLYSQDTIFPVYTTDIPCFTDRPLLVRYDSAIGAMLTDVSVPQLHYYAPVPRAGTGKAVMIVPGGGYAIEAWDHEGVDIARYLSAHGYHAFVLSHRLPARLTGSCQSTAALSDAQAGIRRIRTLADSLGYGNDHVGIMGFSAGGHLAGSASVHAEIADGVTTRPDFSILVYPVTRMNRERNGHPGSQLNLLGEAPSEEALRYYNLPENVDSLTPPTLLIHASDDTGVLPENSLAYYRALVEHGVGADLRMYATGGHGFGSARERPGPVAGWLEEVTTWLAAQ